MDIDQAQQIAQGYETNTWLIGRLTEGLTRDIKRTSYYEKPSERRRRKHRKSMKRVAREAY